MRIGILGGGPGGLYFARLVRRAWPDWHVEIFEQNPRDATFGFGVTLGGTSLERLDEADPELVARLSTQAVFNDKQKISLNGHSILLEYSGSGASIERLALLSVMRDLAQEVGVIVHHDIRIAGTDALADYDLIVGADGANSTMRAEHAEAFGTTCHLLTNRFAWYGVQKFMSPSALIFRSALGGSFIAHYYAYKDNMSTFVAECDEKAWFAGGLDKMDDNTRRLLFEEIFAPELGGAPLIENRSIYRQFPAISTERWVSGNMVLIGDAQRVAHFSIGSGTRLAMDDAHALYEALRDQQDIPQALTLFVERRKPIRDRFARAAELSYNWYERVGEAMCQLPTDFVYDFLTRTGRVDDERLAKYAPSFASFYAERRRASL